MSQDTAHSASDFTAKNAGVVLLVVLVAMLVINPVMVSVFRYFRDNSWLSLDKMTDLEFTGFTRVVGILAVPWFLLGITLALLMSRYKESSLKEVSEKFGLIWRPRTRTVVIAFMSGILFVALFTQLMKVFPPGADAVEHSLNVISNTSIWLQIAFALTVVTIVPVVEELIFRGVLFKGLANSWGRGIAGCVVAVIFILVHPETIRAGYWLTHSALYAISVMLTVARMLTGALTSSIFIHSGFNFAEAFIF